MECEGGRSVAAGGKRSWCTLLVTEVRRILTGIDEVGPLVSLRGGETTRAERRRKKGCRSHESLLTVNSASILSITIYTTLTSAASDFSR